MAISKLILNGEVQMDVTSDTVTAASMLSGTTATKNDGTKATGSIATKTSSNMTVSGATVTAPAGYYANDASKSVSTTTHPNPTATIASSTGVVTASHTQTAGYVTAGTTTGTLNLTTKAAETYYTSIADQTISSYRWLTGAQTIKSVTTSNLTASNIASGVVVKVGDANNASRITQVTGTYAPTTSNLTVVPTETAQTFNATGVYGYKPVTVNAISSTYVGSAIPLKSAADLTQSTTKITAPAGYYSNDATYTMPMATINKLCSIESSTGTIYGGYSVLSSAGYVASFIIRSDSLSLPTVAATTYTPTTTSQIISSYQWLTGVQTIEAIPSAYIIPTGTSNITSNGTYDITSYQSVSVSVAGGLYYGVYKALANRDILWAQGSVTNGYTSTEVSEWANSLTSIASQQFAGQFFFGDFSFNNVTKIGAMAFGSASGMNYSPFNSSFNLTLPAISSLSYNAFISNRGLKEIYLPSCTLLTGQIFYGCVLLKTISAPLCSGIDGYGTFQHCTNLENIYMPKVSYFSFSCFYNCTALSSASFSLVDTIPGFCFTNCSSLSFIDFPICTTIGASAFSGCTNLTSVSFSACTTIGISAFQNCTNLASVNFSACISIYSGAFNNCINLTSVSFPACTTIGVSAFLNCTSLSSVYFPNCTTIGNSAFFKISMLENISFPKCYSIGMSAFAECASLSSIYFPSCTTIGNGAFYSCYNLVTARFPNCSSSIVSNAFRSCHNLISLYLDSVSSVPTLGTYVFSSTPIGGYSTVAGQYGSIYVPSSLYSQFIAKTNWVAFSSRMVSV